ncbi:hypothetical protein [Nocardiopsis composta]|uniref:Uncharacterized protein n=1 Tax=Nocardiopsis composta TaxID=157465 RepID=A0A7W8QKD9_9ACTN|nr:hypothetical protein [Nocardiopsis composta]MBB5431400.1 hypothetical protein [Nocardiopsis composta]
MTSIHHTGARAVPIGRITAAATAITEALGLSTEVHTLAAHAHYKDGTVESCLDITVDTHTVAPGDRHALVERIVAHLGGAPEDVEEVDDPWSEIVSAEVLTSDGIRIRVEADLEVTW